MKDNQKVLIAFPNCLVNNEVHYASGGKHTVHAHGWVCENGTGKKIAENSWAAEVLGQIGDASVVGVLSVKLEYDNKWLNEAILFIRRVLFY